MERRRGIASNPMLPKNLSDNQILIHVSIDRKTCLYRQKVNCIGWKDPWIGRIRKRMQFFKRTSPEKKALKETFSSLHLEMQAALNRLTELRTISLEQPVTWEWKKNKIKFEEKAEDSEAGKNCIRIIDDPENNSSTNKMLKTPLKIYIDNPDKQHLPGRARSRTCGHRHRGHPPLLRSSSRSCSGTCRRRTPAQVATSLRAARWHTSYLSFFYTGKIFGE